jgi:hypothetical protein
MLRANLLRLLLAAPIFLSSLVCAYAQSGPSLTIGFDDTRDAIVLDAAIDIAAPPATVWKVITDCARAPKFVPYMVSCRIVQPGPKGPDVVDLILEYGWLPKMRATTKLDFDAARQMSFNRIAGNIRIAEGLFIIEPTNGGAATRLQFHSAIALGFFVPRLVMKPAAEWFVPAMMKAIERESLADAGKS